VHSTSPTRMETTIRYEFASKEECEAFVSSLTNDDKSGDGDVHAEAQAEQAAASLLAELSIDSSGGVRSKNKGKQQGKRKTKKGRFRNASNLTYIFGETKSFYLPRGRTQCQ
jgi:hypothetical protein